MTRSNNNEENQNTLMAWATGYTVIYAIGIAAGIFIWKSKKIDEALITKIGNRRYLGYLRKDSKGQDYWKYKPLSPENSGEESSEQPNLADNIAKFQQRQEQVRNYANNSNSD